MHWHSRYTRYAALAAVVAAVACTEQQDPAGPLAEIMDGAHNDGNQHFYFLPPMVRTPFYTGTFDPMVAPEVEICEWTGTACGAIVATFTTTTGSGSELVRMEPDHEHYIVNWHTSRDNLDATKTYRIRVLVGSRELGHADVDVVNTGRELRNVNTNEYIALLDDRTLPIKFRIEEGAIAAEERSVVAAGGHHTCALATGGLAYCWGYNVYGQLGAGYASSWNVLPVAVAGGHVFTSVVTGFYHSCGLRSDGTAWCWGYGGYGSLGNGGAASQPMPVAVGGGHVFATLSAGWYSTCGVTEAGAAWCWGYNPYGGLGNGTLVNAFSPTPVSGGHTFQSVQSGVYHACGVTTAGAALCWGINYYGGLGNGTLNQAYPYGLSTTPVPVVGGHTFASITVGTYTTCALDVAGSAWCWGQNQHGSVGSGSFSPFPYGVASPTQVVGGLAFTSLSSTGYHTCGLTGSGAAYCWGYNYYGQVGDGTVQQTVPSGIASPSAVLGGDAWADIDAGYVHTCGVTTLGSAKCWGYNWYGNLGNGTVNQTYPYVTAASSQPGLVGGSLSFEVP